MVNIRNGKTLYSHKRVTQKTINIVPTYMLFISLLIYPSSNKAFQTYNNCFIVFVYTSMCSQLRAFYKIGNIFWLETLFEWVYSWWICFKNIVLKGVLLPEQYSTCTWKYSICIQWSITYPDYLKLIQTHVKEPIIILYIEVL